MTVRELLEQLEKKGLVNAGDMARIDETLSAGKDKHGALIYVSNQGYRHGPKEIIEKLKRGEPVEDGSYYMRCTPWFETSAPAYDWLNRTIFIGTGERDPNGVRLSIFEIT